MTTPDVVSQFFLGRKEPVTSIPITLLNFLSLVLFVMEFQLLSIDEGLSASCKFEGQIKEHLVRTSTLTIHFTLESQWLLLVE